MDIPLVVEGDTKFLQEEMGGLSVAEERVRWTENSKAARIDQT